MMDSAAPQRDRPTCGEIAEFQGLYGAFHVGETLLQKIWLRGEFEMTRARTSEGEPLRVKHPGAWNRLSGPDFQGAEIQIGDRVIVGDVEVHFRAESWVHHGHESDPAYENVVLHVVLFPPAPGFRPARTKSGRPIPLLVLVDLLWHDLEEYASDEAVAALSGVDPLPVVEDLLALEPGARRTALDEATSSRWHEKVHFASLRLRRLGWEEGCHQTALEILGYRSNRVAMLRVAAGFPLQQWRLRAPTLDELVAIAEQGWTSRGVRPANHPRVRLEQYRMWVSVAGNWPQRLRDWRLRASDSKLDWSDSAGVRRRLGLPAVREEIARQMCGGALGGTRLDTWICNLMLPFLAAANANGKIGLGAAPDAASLEAEKLWRVWYPGDAPDRLRQAARLLHSAALRTPLTNGHVQGLLGLQLARQRKALVD